MTSLSLFSQPALTPSIPIPPPGPATAFCRKAGGEQGSFLVVRMNDVLVSSY
jgi:hypothetical protein